MKPSLVVILLVAAFVISPRVQAQDTAQFHLGAGMSVEPSLFGQSIAFYGSGLYVGTNPLYSVSPYYIYIPVTLTKSFRIEPRFGIYSYSSETSNSLTPSQPEKDDITLTNIGLSAEYLIPGGGEIPAVCRPEGEPEFPLGDLQLLPIHRRALSRPRDVNDVGDGLHDLRHIRRRVLPRERTQHRRGDRHQLRDVRQSGLYAEPPSHGDDVDDHAHAFACLDRCALCSSAGISSERSPFFQGGRENAPPAGSPRTPSEFVNVPQNSQIDGTHPASPNIQTTNRMPNRHDHGKEFIKGLHQAWLDEMRSARNYRALASREKNPDRRAILERMAEAEDRHAERWANRLRALGADPGFTGSPFSIG